MNRVVRRGHFGHFICGRNQIICEHFEVPEANAGIRSIVSLVLEHLHDYSQQKGTDGVSQFTSNQNGSRSHYYQDNAKKIRKTLGSGRLIHEIETHFITLYIDVIGVALSIVEMGFKSNRRYRCKYILEFITFVFHTCDVMEPLCTVRDSFLSDMPKIACCKIIWQIYLLTVAFLMAYHLNSVASLILAP